MQIQYYFDKPVSSKAEDLIDELQAAMCRNCQIYSSPVTTLKHENLVVTSVYAAHERAFEEENFSAWGKEILAKLRRLGCVLTFSLISNLEEPEKTHNDLKYHVLFARRYDSSLSDQHGASIALLNLPLSDQCKDQVSAWVAKYNACDDLWLSLNELELSAYYQLASVKSELSILGRTICKELEEASNTPTYYYLFKYWGLKNLETKRLCPGCGCSWCISDNAQADFFQFEFKCDRCRLVSSWSLDFTDKKKARIGSWQK